MYQFEQEFFDVMEKVARRTGINKAKLLKKRADGESECIVDFNREDLLEKAVVLDDATEAIEISTKHFSGSSENRAQEHMLEAGDQISIPIRSRSGLTDGDLQVFFKPGHTASEAQIELLSMLASRFGMQMQKNREEADIVPERILEH